MRVVTGKTKEYYKDNLSKFQEYNKDRRHKNHNITIKEWNACKNYFNNSCAYCSMTLEEHKIKYKEDLHKEHVIHNGENNLSNCIPSCKSCNSSKWEFTLEKWYNEKNGNYTIERLDKILKWLSDDYKKFIEQ
jgi:5-methylcytosine-specific restriction endonuclease McrA